VVTAHMARLAIASLAALAVAVAVPALAQAPPRPLGEGGSIRGRIIDADTGQLATRELTIEVQDGATGMAARDIDAVGEFVVTDLPAGPYLLRVREKGGRSTFATRNVQVAAGATINRADIYLRLPGEINAVVVDGSGEPVQGANVLLVSSGYVFGHAVYTYSQQKTTDDRGYATFSQRVEAGHPYFLLVLPPEASRPALPGTPSLEPIWHPGRPGVMQPLVLRSAERKRIDVVMQKKPTYCVDGKLLANGQPEVLDFEVAIPEVGGYVGFTGGTRGVISRGKSDASGRFKVCGLWPGEFLLAADLSKQFYGRTTVSIVDRDVRNITLNTHSPINLSVEVRWDNGQLPERPFNLQFIPVSRAMFSPPRDPTVWERTSIVVNVPSKFTFSLAASTDYLIRGGLLPITAVSETYFKEVNCGGTISRDFLRLGDTPCNLSITLGTDMGKLAATVVDKDNKPDSNSSVCVAPSSAATKEEIVETGKCSVVTEPETGSLSISVRPGRYLAMVIPPETSDWAEYISTNRAQGQFIEIKPSSTAQLRLKATSR
jgi:hypothetical protein